MGSGGGVVLVGYPFVLPCGFEYVCHFCVKDIGDVGVVGIHIGSAGSRTGPDDYLDVELSVSVSYGSDACHLVDASTSICLLPQGLIRLEG